MRAVLKKPPTRINLPGYSEIDRTGTSNKLHLFQTLSGNQKNHFPECQNRMVLERGKQIFVFCS